MKTFFRNLAVLCIFVSTTQSVLAQAEVQNPTFPFWKSQGNSGTNSSTNFIGTTDNVSLRMRTNNLIRMSIDSNGRVGVNTTTPATYLDVNGSVAWREVSIALTAGNVNNLPILDGSFIRLTSTGNLNISGFAGGTSGRVLTLYNQSINTISLFPNNAGSAAASQLVTGGGTLTLADTGSATFQYSANLSRWVLTSFSNGSLADGAGDQWRLTGNSGTLDGTNFLGTTDAVPFNIRVDNKKAGRIDSVGRNTYYGFEAANLATSPGNTAIGYQALRTATSAGNNTAIGANAMRDNTFGNNVAVGSSAMSTTRQSSHTTAIGYEAMQFDSVGDMNTAVGWRALRNHKSGNENAAFGVGALEFAQYVSNATAIGRGALFTTKTNDATGVGFQAGAQTDSAFAATYVGAYAGYYNEGDYNTYVGYFAGTGQNVSVPRTAIENVGFGALGLRFINAGKSNSSVGYGTMYFRTNGNSNVAMGTRALHGNALGASGSNNVAIGDSAAFRNQNALRNIALGSFAGFNNQNSNDIIAIGDSALFANASVENFAIGNSAGRNNTNTRNFFIGNRAGYNNTIGTLNFFIGALAGEGNVNGNENMAIGRGAFQTAQTTYANTAIGRLSGQYHQSGDYNTYLGFLAGRNDTSGVANTFIGSLAGQFNRTGYYNTGVGHQALSNNRTSPGNVAIGMNAMFNHKFGGTNTAVGYEAMIDDTSGTNNTAMGWRALRFNYAGSNNVALGVGALEFGRNLNDNTVVGRFAGANVEGEQNVLIGRNAATNSTSLNRAVIIGYEAGLASTANENTAVGYFAMREHTTGLNNTSLGAYSMRYANGTENATVGYNALRGNAVHTASANSVLGFNAMLQATTAGQNVAIGHFALTQASTGSWNVAVGAGAMDQTTTGVRNTAVGFWAARNNTTGSGNVAVGNKALYTNTLARHNVAVGDSALHNFTGTASSTHNVAVGYSALSSAIDGAFANTAVGSFSNRAVTTGDYNIAVGYFSNRIVSSGSDNVGIGFYSNYAVSTESNNTSVGSYAGDFYSITNGTFVGAFAYPNAAGYSNISGFGYQARPTASNMIRIGNAAITSINGAVNFTAVSDGRFKRNVTEDVAGLNFVMKLRPVNYQFDVRAMDNFIQSGPRKDHDGNIVDYTAVELKSIAAKEKIRYSGFIAQEVEQAAKEVGYDFSGVDAPDNDRDPYGLRYAEFVVPLTKAMQEQQKIIELLKLKIEQLEQKLETK
jgi:hypothetical protein